MMPAAGTDNKSLISAWKKTNEQELFTNLKTDYGFSQALALKPRLSCHILSSPCGAAGVITSMC